MASAGKKAPGYIEHGSPEHAALLGLSNVGTMTEEQKANLQLALKTKPVPVSQRQPVVKDNYEPATANQPGDEVFDGWVYLE